MSLERDYIEDQIRDAELRHRKALEQMSEVDKQIKELEVGQFFTEVNVIILAKNFQLIIGWCQRIRCGLT